MLENWTVLYRTNDSLPFDMPMAFICQAEDMEHAEEQLENAEPTATIVWAEPVDTADECISRWFRS